MAHQIYGLLGRTLGHSWSVPIHTALGCYSYRLIELEPEQLPGFLARKDIGGLNVTIPYKRAVMDYCDVIDDKARAIGSVNTLVRRRDGKLYGYNTDADGFCWMAQRAGLKFAGRKVLVLGSGGASRTVQAMAGQLGASQVVVISRSGGDNYQNIARHADAQLVINTTPLGTFPDTGVAAVDLRGFPRCQGVLDLVYNPRRTALLLQAEELGIPRSDGLPMLVAQAKAAEELFFQTPISDKENLRILARLRRESTNIVLVGMPGSGKTTVGRALSVLTGREAIDLDACVREQAGCSIAEIFARDGEAAFRALEREVTARVGKLSGKLILTGGGVVTDARNYPSLHQNGRIYQLERRLTALSTEGRPLSQRADLVEMYRTRAPLYAGFRDAVIDNNGAVEEAAAEIWRDFCENSCD